MSLSLKPYILLLCLSAFWISSCSEATHQPLEDNRSRTQTSETAKSTEGININKAVVIPPGYNERPDIDNPLDANNADNAFSKNMKGLNLETLFHKNIDDVDERFERLEKAVIDFRREYEETRPAIMRLTAIESDIQALIEDLQILVKSEDSNPETMPEAPNYEVENLNTKDRSNNNLPEPVKEKTLKSEKNDTTKITNNVSLQGIRLGLHKNKERIVIELSAKTPYHINLDSQERILVVSFEGIKKEPSAIKGKQTLKSYVLSSYDIADSTQDLSVIFQLKKSTDIIHTEWLNASKQFPSHRLIIDLKN